ncbi:MAG: lactonase family protein [Ruminococcaceae bacterium]|nr:lactonase family protein [Oscillospiraceae bacterium]
MTYEVMLLSCTEAGGIFRYELDDNGQLHFLDQCSLDKPMYLIQDQNDFYVLLKSIFPESGLQKLVRNESGGLQTEGEIICTKGREVCHHCVFEKNVYCVNYTSGSVFSYPEGKLVIHEGSSVHPTRQTSAHTHYINSTPDEKYLAVVDLGMDEIITYDKNLNQVCSSKMPVGSGCRHLVFSKDGSLAYCVGELDSTVTVLSYSDGHFTPLHSYSLLPEGYTEKSTAAAIRLYEEILYVSNRGHDSIARFRIKGSELEFLGWFDCGGQEPRDFEVTKEWIVCANQSGNCGTVLNRETGDVVCRVELKQALGVVIIPKEEMKC